MMISFTLLQLLLSAVAIASSTTTTTTTTTITAVDTKNHPQGDDIQVVFDDLVQWFRSMDGAEMNAKLILQRTTTTTTNTKGDQRETNGVGIFTTSNIQKDEILLIVPRSVLITSKSGTLKDTKNDDNVSNHDDSDAEDDDDDGTNWCRTVHNLVREMKLGTKSIYGPYIQYLMTTINISLLPSGWSKAGQELLLDVLEQSNDDDTDNLPPLDACGWIESDWYNDCGGRRKSDHHDQLDDDNDDDDDDDDDDDIALEHKAALLVLQRGWDDIMTPMFDVMNHRNGKWTNTKSTSIHADVSTPIVVTASRNIQAGEEIYTTFNFCTDCDKNQFSGYGTPELFRDYGFVEEYPQRWYFGNLAFDMNQGENDNDDHHVPGTLTVDWIYKRSAQDTRSIQALLTRYERLSKRYEIGTIGTLMRTKNISAIPKHEMDMILQYYDALTTAMKIALIDLGVPLLEDTTTKNTNDNNTNKSNNTKTITNNTSNNCQMKNADGQEMTLSSSGSSMGSSSCNLSFRYDELEEIPDPINYATYTCDTSISMSYDGFETLESTHSHYQKIDFFKDPLQNDNVCLDISEIIQICGSYRPYYHEMIVHYTARYIPTVKRVLFVGGGDSMLLHEILKYPSLEKVVGLELDQVITRLSFKHFGTQPHFDQHHKVEWWYGDASKSLLMLPADYFGTFDMVLVDLSETVMSLLVTDGLDIFQALGLLLAPRGILVKNELYLEHMSDIFDYSIQIHVPEQPVICSQCLIMGSNQVDFLMDDLYDHQLDHHPTLGPNLYIKPQSEINDRYELFHDYRHNSTSEHLCKDDNGDDEVSVVQKRSPGILMILEAEDTTKSLEDTESVLTAIVSAINKQGLHVRSNATWTIQEDEEVDDDFGSILWVLLEEGYIMIRTWPQHKYCAMDIHLWSRFEKHDHIKDALIHAVGSSSATGSSSAYRIVAGGMFGMKTWIDDEKKRGPRVMDTCRHEEEQQQQQQQQQQQREVETEAKAHEKARQSTIANHVFREAFSLIQEASDMIVLVICGDGIEDCKSLDLFEKEDNSEHNVQVIPVTSCPEIGNEYAEWASQNMMACERKVLSLIKESLLENVVSSEKRIRTIVVDPSATYSFMRIMNRVFVSHVSMLFDRTSLAVMTVIFDEETESWRRNLLERFRTDIIYHDPCFRAEVLFYSTEDEDIDGSSQSTTLPVMEMGVVSSGDPGFVQRLTTVVSKISNGSTLSVPNFVSDIRNIQGGPFVLDPDWKASHFFFPEDYNQRPPLEQWVSQHPLGYQTVVQLEAAPIKTTTTTATEDNYNLMSMEIIQDALQSTIQGVLSGLRTNNREDLIMENDAKYRIVSSIHKDAITAEVGAVGEGCVVGLFWDDGYCMVVWDGRNHIDLNVFLWGRFMIDVKDENKAMDFILKVKSQFPSVFQKISLQDVQPRGYGRVVNFWHDIHAFPNDHPHWARF